MWSRGCSRSTMIQVIALTLSLATVIAASCSQTTVYKTVPVSLTNFCSLKPCLNNGTCVTGTTSSLFSCICKQGYTGKVCEIDLMTTAASPGSVRSTATASSESSSTLSTQTSTQLTTSAAPSTMNEYLSIVSTADLLTTPASTSSSVASSGISIGDIITTFSSAPADCHDWYLRGQTVSGVYTVMIIDNSHTPLSVYCDMKTTGGGWTVFQRRQDGSVAFYRNWADYQTGFGDISGEFWIGNDILYLLTSAKRYKLRVDLTSFDGLTAYAEYDNFKVGSAADEYKLSSIGNYSGTARDALRSHEGNQFSTKDQDNDLLSSGNCAVTFRGAWWYTSCASCNLNANYYPSSPYEGVFWLHWKGNYESMKRAEMKISPFV